MYSSAGQYTSEKKKDAEFGEHCAGFLSFRNHHGSGEKLPPMKTPQKIKWVPINKYRNIRDGSVQGSDTPAITVFNPSNIAFQQPSSMYNVRTMHDSIMQQNENDQSINGQRADRKNSRSTSPLTNASAYIPQGAYVVNPQYIQAPMLTMLPPQQQALYQVPLLASQPHHPGDHGSLDPRSPPLPQYELQQEYTSILKGKIELLAAKLVDKGKECEALVLQVRKIESLARDLHGSWTEELNKNKVLEEELIRRNRGEFGNDSNGVAEKKRLQKIEKKYEELKNIVEKSGILKGGQSGARIDVLESAVVNCLELYTHIFESIVMHPDKKASIEIVQKEIMKFFDKQHALISKFGYENKLASILKLYRNKEAHHNTVIETSQKLNNRGSQSKDKLVDTTSKEGSQYINLTNVGSGDNTANIEEKENLHPNSSYYNSINKFAQHFKEKSREKEERVQAEMKGKIAEKADRFERKYIPEKKPKSQQSVQKREQQERSVEYPDFSQPRQEQSVNIRVPSSEVISKKKAPVHTVSLSDYGFGHNPSAQTIQSFNVSKRDMEDDHNRSLEQMPALIPYPSAIDLEQIEEEDDYEEPHFPTLRVQQQTKITKESDSKKVVYINEHKQAVSSLSLSSLQRTQGAQPNQHQEVDSSRIRKQLMKEADPNIYRRDSLNLTAACMEESFTDLDFRIKYPN